ncbi:hypothetical protein L9F63_023312 [Diploptera punctata]|uniref:PBZ-type domain-containing protein n=1 Tax=Diploptera punctata TaxID=6984 RepID=A0AAD7ZJ49_DIPPU|nr:hypothetical protein L9F63_023312 [Diploptera punctata]
MATGNGRIKRTNSDTNSPSQKKKSKLCCQFGEKCYRRNPVHFSEYSHPHLDKLYVLQKDGEDIKLPDGFKPKIDANVIIDQLQLYRDHGFGVDLQPEKQKQSISKQSQDRGSPVTAAPSTTSNNAQDVTKINKQDLPTPSSNSTSSSATQRTDMRRQWQDDDLPPGSPNHHRISIKRPFLDDPSMKIQDLRKNISQIVVNKIPIDGSRMNLQTSRGIPNSPSSSSVVNNDLKNKNMDARNGPDGNGSSKEGSSGHQNNRNLAVKKGFAAKLAAAAPYNFFLTAIRDSSPTHREPLSISYHNLLDPSMGDLDSSLQINFMVELDWLMEQYKEYGHDKKPLLILYGVEDEMLQNPKSLPSNISVKKIKTTAFGHHHTKMSLFYYKDHSLRVVVSTANLISSDWYNRTQGVWVSPACPELPPESDTRAGESPTEFKADLLRYMANYQIPALQEWLSRLRRTDFSSIRVCFVASVPGSHRGPESDKWGHRRLGHLLRKFAVIPSLLSPMASKESWPIIAQCSSIGTLGADADSWMCGELRTSMSQKCLQPGDLPQPPPQFRVIYPSLKNVKSSHDDLLGGACLPYSRKTHEKQLWFRKFLFCDPSDKRHRTKAVPHIKTYARVSPCGRHLAWFHLTSANLSKAAWGKLQEAKGKNLATGLYIMSYEAGVLFLPKLLVNEPVFHLDGDGRVSDSNPPFPLPWDLPLSAYAADDLPWVNEYLN